ncbi:helix-turn-helix domain-containing protein [Kitasatospora sp. NPDC056184]|uniref:helix-turn-helix domain-containing protein n=1 Tax=Kitasatospora sp. NPDC056184 TaxID=3345738 RepID=UPI0035E3B0E8
MRPVETPRAAAPLWDVTTPVPPGRIGGIAMAGFRARTAGPLDLEVVPYPAVTVAVDLGDAPLAVGGAEGGPQETGSVVVGLAPHGLRGRGRDVECLQIRLSPVVAHAVLGPTGDLRGGIVRLDDLWGRDAARTQERLRAAGSWADRFAIAEAALARRYRDGPAVDPEVAFAWGQLVAHRGNVRIDGLAAGAGWSRKRLWSRFRHQIGLTPKHAARLVRFDHAAHRLAAGQRPALVAAEAGYADQSHLHREVVAFAGATPTAVAAAPWLTVDDDAWAAPGYLRTI